MLLAATRSSLLFHALLCCVSAQSLIAPCLRWAHMATLGSDGSSHSDPDSTLWLYGGNSASTPGVIDGSATNALFAIDLTRSWPITAPAIRLVQNATNDQNPPRVSLGALWSSKDGNSLYQSFGYFQDDPFVMPVALQLFKYDVVGAQWSVVQTSGDSIVRAGEGAPAQAPGAGTNGESLAFYAFGHEDQNSVRGWSPTVERVYLSSTAMLDLGSFEWKNISEYSSSATDGSGNSTVETSPIVRSDSTLSYVPNMGTDNKGILVSIGGGNAAQLLAQNVIDIYDIGAAGWTRQATQGVTMPGRVNHCAAVGTRKVNDIEHSFIFVFGGQASNITTQDAEGQNNDLYVLHLPSYTWSYIGTNLPSSPTGRAGHTCTLSGSQMIVVGGYVNENVECDAAVSYILDTTSLAWKTSYDPTTSFHIPTQLTNLTGGDDDSTSSNKGAIIGGSVGGIVALLLLLLLLCFLIKKRRSQTRHDISPGSMEPMTTSGRYEKQPSSVGHGGYFAGSRGSDEVEAADDNVEESMANYDINGTSHLAPRRTLRVVN